MAPSLSLLALLAVDSAWAVEVTGQIRGTVTDADGLPIPGVVVTVASPNFQGGASSTTNEDGAFRFPALPPGEYTVEARKDAFLPYRATGLLVSAGGTSGLEVQLKLAQGSAELTIEEVKPAIDTQRVQTGAVLTRETLRDIPNRGRSYQSATAIAPGVVGSGNANVRGSHSDSNQFYVDGVNNTDPMTGTFSQNMNFDAIEEIQVVTGGMDAEYGRSLGGAINVVTRSGGNEIHGDAQFLHSNKLFQVYEPLPDEDEQGEFLENSLALNVGGPIAKDRLWFFVSLQGDLKTNYPTPDPSIERPEGPAGEIAPRIWKSGYWFGKLTWRANDQNRVWFQAQGDPTYIENTEEFYGSLYTLPNGETVQKQGGFLLSLGHLFTPSEKQLLQTQFFFQRSNIAVFPVQCKGQEDDLQACLDEHKDERWLSWDPDGFNAGMYPYAYTSSRYRVSGQTAFTQYATFLGEHAFKVGVNGEYLVNDDTYPGYDDIVFKTRFTSTGDVAAADTDNYENAYRYVQGGDLYSNLGGLLVSGFVQDVWNPVQRLTVRPGVRMDYSRIGDDTGELAWSSITFAPRFGLAYDLTSDGRTNAHAFYGRFYDSGFLAISSMLAKKGSPWGYYPWDAESQTWSDTPAFAGGAVNLIHDDLDNPYSDEFDVGIGRAVGGGWGVDGTFTYEYTSNFWDDDEVNLIWNADGTDVVGYRNGVNESLYRIRTAEDLYVQYTSVEMTATKQFDEGVGIVGSYTWSKAYGNKQDEDALSASGNLDIPEQNEVSEGLLPYDVTHQIKFAGSARDPDAFRVTDNVALGLLAGWNFTARSGYPYRPAYYNSYYSDWSNYRESIDGSYRLPMRSQLDLKGGVTLAVAKTSWDLTVECFNVFNERTVTDVDTVFANETNDGPYVDEDGFPIFGRPTARQAPRYLQFGLRGEF